MAIGKKVSPAKFLGTAAIIGGVLKGTSANSDQGNMDNSGTSLFGIQWQLAQYEFLICFFLTHQSPPSTSLHLSKMYAVQ